MGASAVATTTAARAASARVSNPLLIFAAPAPGSSLRGASSDVGGQVAFRPLAAALPPQVAVVSLQLLPAGFNLSSLFPRPPLANGADRAQKPSAASGALLLRLRHIYQAGMDNATLAVPVSVDLAAALAPHWRVAAAVEWAVDASQPMAAASATRINWLQQPGGNKSGGKHQGKPGRSGRLGEDLHRRDSVQGSAVVTLRPMELKTLVLQLA